MNLQSFNMRTDNDSSDLPVVSKLNLTNNTAFMHLTDQSLANLEELLAERTLITDFSNNYLPNVGKLAMEA